MKISELLARQPESHELWDSKDQELLQGHYFNHLPEAFENSWYDLAENTLIYISTYKDFSYDGRRCWRLLVWSYDGTPVMVTQNAGREGDDHYKRYVFNETAYKYMVEYVKSLMPPEVSVTSDLVGIETDIPTLTMFYGQDLDGVFEHYSTYGRGN